MDKTCENSLRPYKYKPNLNNNNTHCQDKNFDGQTINGDTKQMIPEDMESKDETRNKLVHNCNNTVAECLNGDETATNNHQRNGSTNPPSLEIDPTLIPLASLHNSNDNSTDNLSYTSDNNYIDELLLLQSTVSDEEEHLSINSDDCVYAYRGADLDQLAQQNRNSSNMDDETDFLEMDFDPDPLSEVEQSSADDVFDQKEFEKEILMNEQRLHLNEGNGDGILNGLINIQQQNNSANTINSSFAAILANDNNLKLSNAKNDTKCNGNTKKNESDFEMLLTTDTQYKETGTKPKRIVDCRNGGGSSNNTTNKSRKYQFDNSHEIIGDSGIEQSAKMSDKCARPNNTLNSSRIGIDSSKETHEDSTCLDCLESEFLQMTVGRTRSDCPKCLFKKQHIGNNISNTMLHETQTHINQNNHESLSFDIINDLFSTDVYKSAILRTNQRSSSCDKLNNGDMLLRKTSHEISTISSINVNFDIIVQALDKVKISYNEAIIRGYFVACERTEFVDVADYLVYCSKKNCNYKKIMKLIKLASKDQVYVEFDYDENSPTYQLIEVKVIDIIQCWIRHNDLTSLKTLNKRFFEMNILGKIINIIRQAQQRATKDLLKEFIVIPQYYKAGTISISKKLTN